MSLMSLAGLHSEFGAAFGDTPRNMPTDRRLAGIMTALAQPVSHVAFKPRLASISLIGTPFVN
jgi:hypothetical protein